MSIYIISNRKVVEQNGTERFLGHGKDSPTAGQPNFRVATYKDEEKPDYDILPDFFDNEYKKVAQAIEKDDKNTEFAGSAQMFYDLYWKMIDDSEQSDVLFFIHGFATSLDDELEHIALLKKLYLDPKNTPTKHMVYVSWPTRNHVVLTYWGDQYDAKVTGDNISRLYLKLASFFQTLFSQYKQRNCGSKIHLMAHSMGNQVLEHLLLGLKERYIIPLIDEVFLLHSDVDHDVFEPGGPFNKLRKLGHRTHIYLHKSDDALTISTLTKNLRARLGKRGPSNVRDLNEETFIMDVTGVKYKRSKPFLKRLKNSVVDHWGYLYSDDVIDDIKSVLNGHDENRIPNRLRHDQYTNYFIFEESSTGEFEFRPNMSTHKLK